MTLYRRLFCIIFISIFHFNCLDASTLTVNHGQSEVEFRPDKDLICLHHDFAPDPDDGHATVANKTIVSQYGIIPLVVAGAHDRYNETGKNNYQTKGEVVMQAAWGNNWLNAHADWQGSVKKAADAWRKTLDNGGHIWIAEGGMADFTADVLKSVSHTYNRQTTRKRIHIIQHSRWNENHSTPDRLTYVKKNTHYLKIDDGNSDQNDTAGLMLKYSSNNKSTIERFMRQAEKSRYADIWQAAFDFLSLVTDQGWPEGRKLDFSDTVELLYILGIEKTTIDNCTDFATIFLKNKESVFPGKNWQKASPDSQGVDGDALDNAMQYLDKNLAGVGTDEMVIVRNGYIIYDGAAANSRHSIYSGTKTFTTTVLGLLIKEGRISSINDRAVKYLPRLDDEYPAYSAITLKQLATFTSGYTADITAKPDMHWGNPNGYLTPGRPSAPPGTQFNYHDPGMHQLGNILTRVSGEGLEQTFKTKVADIIGMQNWQWHHCGYGNNGESTTVVANFLNPSGIYGGGIHATALDIARYGLLYLNRGNWNGRQILSPGWVDEATTNQVPLDISNQGPDQRGRMGYLWWTNGIGVNGARRWPSAPAKTYTFHGRSRNFCFVVPEWNMVIVRLSPPASTATEMSVWDGFFSRLSPGISD
ncbi:serine hydrolase domain-containing protein [Desulfosarcina variabilis]|uniref:serine hydrolase domain-containing protein n=1 Tax=Desulfosarcina variabilis TaxID=2300 RepID=UPI003AFA4FB8